MHYSRKTLVLVVVGLLICWPMPSLVQAAAGNLDPTFGIGGKVITDFFGSSSQAHALAIQNDGKIVAAGLSLGDFALARYNRDGSLDTAFGSGGMTTEDFGEFDVARAVGIQSDGKIVMAGKAGGPGGSSSDFGLLRYNSNGSLDAGFGSGGRVTTDFFGAFDEARALTIQHDGRIVVAGFAGIPGPGHADFALARYERDGSLDTTFGSGGKVTTDFFFGPPDPFIISSDSANAVAVQSDGKIVAAGNANPTGSFGDFALARYNSDGSLDEDFGSGGKVTLGFPPNPSSIASVAVLGSGKIVAAGNARGDFALSRFNSNGDLDTSFGSGGATLTDFFGRLDEANALAIQSNGKIVVAGTAQNERNTFIFGLTRYSSDGILEASFGSGGRTTTSFFDSNDFAQALALQTDGRIVVAGIASRFPDIFYFALARYEGDLIFDFCLQGDSNANLLRITSTTGDYQFTDCAGFTISGKGTLTRRGSTITLQHYAADRRVRAQFGSMSRGSASVQLFSPSRTFNITDRNTSNNTCNCP